MCKRWIVFYQSSIRTLVSHCVPAFLLHIVKYEVRFLKPIISLLHSIFWRIMPLCEQVIFTFTWVQKYYLLTFKRRGWVFFNMKFFSLFFFVLFYKKNISVLMWMWRSLVHIRALSSKRCYVEVKLLALKI